MGSGSWTASSWDSYATKNVRTKSSVSGSSGLYSSGTINSDLDPKNFEFRESCDSNEHPKSRPIIVALDVTGSMSNVLESIAREGLNTFITETYDRKPVEDPQIMFMGVGDVYSDKYPLQVTQFESDIRIAEQLQKIYFEQGGGGNNCESYQLPYYYAKNHIKIDSYEKRNQKGILFTIGDECPPKYLSKSEIKEFIGDNVEKEKYTTEELLDAVSREWDVFHLIIEEGWYCSRNKDKVLSSWRELLGERAILVSDYNKIAEIMVSILQRMNGEEVEDIVSSWTGDTSLVVKKAINELGKSNKEEIVEF